MAKASKKSPEEKLRVVLSVLRGRSGGPHATTKPASLGTVLPGAQWLLSDGSPARLESEMGRPEKARDAKPQFRGVAVSGRVGPAPVALAARSSGRASRMWPLWRLSRPYRRGSGRAGPHSGHLRCRNGRCGEWR